MAAKDDQKRDDILKRMLATPPKPHIDPDKKKPTKAKKKKQK